MLKGHHTFKRILYNILKILLLSFSSTSVIRGRHPRPTERLQGFLDGRQKDDDRDPRRIEDRMPMSGPVADPQDTRSRDNFCAFGGDPPPTQHQGGIRRNQR